MIVQGRPNRFFALGIVPFGVRSAETVGKVLLEALGDGLTAPFIVTVPFYGSHGERRIPVRLGRTVRDLGTPFFTDSTIFFLTSNE
jgi:hypothetical protein